MSHRAKTIKGDSNNIASVLDTAADILLCEYKDNKYSIEKPHDPLWFVRSLKDLADEYRLLDYSSDECEGLYQ